MKNNVGSADRLFRIALGIILIALPFVSGLALFQSGTATAVAVIIGLVMLATAGMRFCPLYRLIGMNTCKL